jgi:pyruvate dehydrogenase E2 component (dihydrolipoamide acetyltransferase)
VSDRVVELTRIERIVAARLAQSRATIPDFTLETDVDVTGLLARRGSATVNHHILHACAAALAMPEHERLRGRFEDDRIVIRDEVNLGFAVATERGLMVPVIHAADRLSLAELSARARELAAAARAGKLRVSEATGGVFSVTNLGMFGITRFQPVIDPDHAAILSVGSVRGSTLALTISADHRVVDGAGAARFLSAVRERLE